MSSDKLRLHAHRGAVTNRIIPFEIIWGTKPPERTKLEARVRKTSAQFRVSKELAALVSWQSLTCPQLQEWVTHFWLAGWWEKLSEFQVSFDFWLNTSHCWYPWIGGVSNYIAESCVLLLVVWSPQHSESSKADAVVEINMPWLKSEKCLLLDLLSLHNLTSMHFKAKLFKRDWFYRLREERLILQQNNCSCNKALS